MSSQQDILRKIPGKGIWTAPSRDQYLPAYFKEVVDRYLKEPEARELKPVKVCSVNSVGWGFARWSSNPVLVDLYVLPQLNCHTFFTICLNTCPDILISRLHENH